MDGPQPAAEIQGLHARYGRVEAVSGLDLTIDQGSLVALLGPNGAGKSTTINCLIGLKHVDEGRVLVAGTAPRQAVRNGVVGAMLQVSGLPSGAKVRDVLRLASVLHRGRSEVDRLLAVAGLEEVAGREVTRLSGGQAQRVSSLLVVLPVVVFVAIAAIVLGGVELSAARWLVLAASVVLGSIPVALIGLIVGLAFRSEAAQAAQAVAFVALAFLGGVFAQAADPPAVLRGVVQVTPSYYLVALARRAVGGEGSVAVSIVALAAMTVVLVVVVALLRRRSA